MSNQEHLDIVGTTKKWIKMFVIKIGLCPFASRSFDADRIKYEVYDSNIFPEALRFLHEFIEKYLDDNEENISNGFVIFPNFFEFLDLLDLKSIFDSFLKSSGKDGEYQTVAFHPDFRFEGEDEDDPGNFVNRAPFPMIHILRVDEVSRALDSLTNAHEIPEHNRMFLEMLDIQDIESIFTEEFQQSIEELKDSLS